MVKYLLQHWHLYQPRENGEWVERIDRECYRPNSENGILRHTSYDVGPTLTDWMHSNDQDTLEKIVSQDNGQAIAQSYNHRILPLCRYDEDVATQIIWGKKHFKKFFGRNPEGMWLPETATSKRVLKEMAKEGIKYTIGAYWQKKNGFDTTKPFKVDLGNGQEITYLFYNGLSWDIADNREINGTRMLDNADNAARIIDSSVQDGDAILLAYDGETFGHHHKFANMWAEYLPKAVEKINGMKFLTIPEYLKESRPSKMTDIFDNSSWSCHCGNLDRWTNGCGCAGGNRTYQRPLLNALNRVEDLVHETFITEGGKYLVNPWEARNDYVDILMGDMPWDEFFSKHLKTRTSLEKRENIKTLLSAEYSVQLSFTSCGWFFSEFSIQTTQSIVDGYNALVSLSKVIPSAVSAIPIFCSDISKSEDYVHEQNGKMAYRNGLDELKKHLMKK